MNNKNSNNLEDNNQSQSFGFNNSVNTNSQEVGSQNIQPQQPMQQQTPVQPQPTVNVTQQELGEFQQNNTVQQPSNPINAGSFNQTSSDANYYNNNIYNQAPQSKPAAYTTNGNQNKSNLKFIIIGIVIVAILIGGFFLIKNLFNNNGSFPAKKSEYFTKIIGEEYAYFGYQEKLPESKLRVNSNFKNEAEAQPVAEKIEKEINNILVLDKNALNRLMTSEYLKDESIGEDTVREGYQLMIKSKGYSKIKNALEKSNYQVKAYYIGKSDYDNEYTAVVVIRGGSLETEVDYNRLITKVDLSKCESEDVIEYSACKAKEYDKIFKQALSQMSNKKYHTQDIILPVKFKINNNEIELTRTYNDVILNLGRFIESYYYGSQEENFKTEYPYALSGEGGAGYIGGFNIDLPEEHFYDLEDLENKLNEYKTKMLKNIDNNGLKNFDNEQSYARAFTTKYNAKLIDKFGLNRVGILYGDTQLMAATSYYESYWYNPLEMSLMVSLMTYKEQEIKLSDFLTEDTIEQVLEAGTLNDYLNKDQLNALKQNPSKYKEIVGDIVIKSIPKYDTSFSNDYDKYINDADNIISKFLPKYKISRTDFSYLKLTPIYHDYFYGFINYFSSW